MGVKDLGIFEDACITAVTIPAIEVPVYVYFNNSYPVRQLEHHLTIRVALKANRALNTEYDKIFKAVKKQIVVVWNQKSVVFPNMHVPESWDGVRGKELDWEKKVCEQIRQGDCIAVLV